MSAYAAPAGTRIGHVHLRVADLDRAIRFYGDVLGFSVQARLGDQAAFLGAELTGAEGVGGEGIGGEGIGGGDGTIYHHHIGLNTWGSRGGTPPPPGHTGLYHTAILYPDRAALAAAVRRVLEAGVRLTGATDHGISEAVYLDDPDGNGVELYRDRHADQWPREANGDLAFTLKPLDVGELLATHRS